MTVYLMTKFAELHSRFVTWDIDLNQYNQKAELVMLAFYGGFCRYLGINPATDGDVVILHQIIPMLKAFPGISPLTIFLMHYLRTKRVFGDLD